MTGLTLPEVTDAELARIIDAAGPDATVTVVDGVEGALPHAAHCEVLLGFLPRKLFAAAPSLRWVHATASFLRDP